MTKPRGGKGGEGMLIEGPDYTDLQIVRVYAYKGVNIMVLIDLVAKRLTLLDGSKSGEGKLLLKRKEWVFAERTHAYLPGWLLILEAMQYAIIEAGKVLADAEARDENKFMELFVAVHIANLAKKKA